MNTDAARVTLDYLDAVHRRAHDPLEPPGFAPDWADRPLPHTHHPGAERLPLPFPATLAQPVPQGPFGLDSLAADLQAAIGIGARRYQVDWNADLADRAAPHTVRWGRGTPSGGAAYPVEVYWAAGPSAPVPGGVFHYASGLHAMERLSAGDPTAAVHAALGPGAAALGDQFLLCTVRLWKNAFKYHNLAYHLATLDLGAFTGSWELLSRDRGLPYRQRVWFDQDALNALLGLDPDAEAVHAVLPLRWRVGEPPVAPAAPVTVRPPHHERSSAVRDFALARGVQRATAAAPATAPRAVTLDEEPVPSGAVALPGGPDARPAGRAAATLARRSSASGRFDASRPLEPAALAAVLRATAPADRTTHEHDAHDEPAALTGLSVVVRRVHGLDPGIYGYHAGSHTLAPVPGDGPAAVTEELYGLDNYSVGQAPAMLVLHWHPGRTVSAYGPRAYRAANIEAGAAAQRAHLAATALDLASGIVLGMDAVPLDAALGLTGRGRHSQVYVFLGHHRPGAAGLDGRLR
ncbi:nitroreductase family protein [Streptomyces sp. NPDC101227]|uniref:nitroreductase family protein n=1 Tax=Streptomyces sp. NPDC101227 TaxID=3366136 RepID=UPI0037F2D781